jgi:hypothetical protein
MSGRTHRGPIRNPGDLVNTLLTVDSVGGNLVRSYMGVVAPDEMFWPQIEPVFLRFVELFRSRPFPWELEYSECLFQLGMERRFTSSWRASSASSYKACVLVHPVMAM